MDRKIVFFDVDGTLVDSCNRVPESAVSAIHQLRKNGHMAFVNSGRTLFDLEGSEQISRCGFDGYISGCGTHIRAHGENLQYAQVPASFHEVILESARQNHIRLFLEGPEHVYIDVKHSAELGADALIIRLKDSIKDLSDPQRCFQKFLSWADTEEEMQRFAEDIKEVFTPICQESGCREFIMNGYSKGNGIRFLLKHYGLTEDDCYIFGDSLNDVTMFECCRHSILMGNGNDALKNQVEYVTKSVTDDGIAYALKHYGLI